MESNEGLSLIVTIDGIEEDKGNIEICLVSDKTLFLKACDFHESILVSGQSSLQYRFENIPAGMYAVSLFHDLNQNQLLDKRSFLSIPKEPFGFSNNPHLVFGPPKFDDCLFDLQEADQEVKIKLRRF